jgi:hypothetical protein
MALSKQTLYLAKWLYWIILTCVHLYLCYILFTLNRAIAGILWLILGFILIAIMYPVYFPPGNPGSQWPPYISACPDYLTMIGANACVDYVGLHSSPLLTKSDPANPPVITDSARVFNSGGSIANKASAAKQYNLSWEGVA